MPVEGAREKIVGTLATWPEVAQAPHRYGGTEFRYGSREVGHIHGNALVDVPLPKAVRDELIAAREAEPHHILPDSGWVSVWLRAEADIDKALGVLRRSFDLAQAQRERYRSVAAAN
jgi:hypothetical protein